ncbi:MAG: ABC transporter permease [Oscillospiraceae bacterium]|nr:ABC transporter permease [Oscillospiraceae bacterium]
MNKYIFSLALEGTRRRKSQTILVVAILAVSIAFVVMMISSTDSITETNKDYRYSVYGSWYGAIGNGMDGDEVFLTSQEWLDSLGVSTSCGTISTSYYTSAFGTIDENLSDMGITLIDGRLPQEYNEIAVEESLISALGLECEVGDTVTLNISYMNSDGGAVSVRRNFTLCGIISDYTQLWAVSDYTTLVGAVVTEDTLEAVVSEAKAKGATNSYGTSYFFTVIDGYEEEMQMDVNNYLRESRPEGLLSSLKSVAVNTRAYGSNETDSDYNITYIAMIFVISLIAVIVIYVLQMQTEIRKIVHLRSLGSTKGQLALLITYESLITCIPAMIIGTIVGAIGTWLLLRLSVFGGSVAVTVSIPWGILLSAIVLWILGVLVIRMVTFMVALATPLTGRMGMTTKKKKFYVRLQRILISTMSIVLCASVIFTVLNSLSPLYGYKYWSNMYDYSLSRWTYLANVNAGDQEELYNTNSLEVITDENIEAILSVPGINNARGYTQMEINVLVDSEAKDAYIYVIDSTKDWSGVFDLSGIDTEAFENGDGILLAFTSKDYNPGFSKGDTITLCPDTFLGAIEAFVDGEVMDIDIVDSVSYSYIGSTGSDFAVVCSRAYFQKILSAMPDNIKWYGGTSNSGFYNYSKVGFTDLFVYADRNIADSATDKTLTSTISNLNININSNQRTVNKTYAQDNFQSVILLFVSGGCIAVVVLIILFSTIRLETQREKKRYGILQAIGMSHKQRNLELMRTAFIRATVAVVLGWGAYFITVIFGNLNSLKEESATVLSFLSDYMSELTTRYISDVTMIVMTVVVFAVILAICYISKLVLNKYTLMEMLREDR